MTRRLSVITVQEIKSKWKLSWKITNRIKKFVSCSLIYLLPDTAYVTNPVIYLHLDLLRRSFKISNLKFVT